jgi:hypothetical protein
MVPHITSEISNVLKIHEYIIVLEDDIQVTNNFFKNITDGLNYLNKLEARGLVSGYSPFFNSKFKNKWRETHIFFCWGWACSRNTWAVYDFNIKSRRVNHELSHSKSWQQLNSYQKKYWLTKIHHSKKHPLFTWDHQFMFHSFVNNFINLSPVFSMVNNEGFDDNRAVHTKGKKPRNISDKKMNNKKIKKEHKEKIKRRRRSKAKKKMRRTKQEGDLKKETKEIRGNMRKSTKKTPK